MQTATLENMLQLAIPEAISKSHGWQPGMQFIIFDTAEGILLKPVKWFPEKTLEDVYGCIQYHGPAKTIEEMDGGIAKGVKEQEW